jgi:hypothetical protein
MALKALISDQHMRAGYPSRSKCSCPAGDEHAGEGKKSGTGTEPGQDRFAKKGSAQSIGGSIVCSDSFGIFGCTSSLPDIQN